MTAATHLTPAEMLAACLARGATYDPDNVSTATGDYDGPGVRCIAAVDLLAMADEGADREERWLERGLR